MNTQYSNRITGENGIAKLLIQMNTFFEGWENKLITVIHQQQSIPNR